MTETNTAGVIVEWKGGSAEGFASKQEAERFVEHICRKTAPHLDYKIYSLNRNKS